MDHLIQGAVDHGALINEDDHLFVDGPCPGVLVQLRLAG